MGATAALLTILNVLQVILSLGLTCTSLWFFVEVNNITSLRNSNHYLLDYKVYWPQAMPWVYILVGLFVICVSGCGFVSAKKKSSGFVKLYLVFQATAILALIGAAIVAFVLADAKATKTFMEDAIWDVYTHMKTDRSVEGAFGNLEKRFQCCGAEGPRDYKNWKDEFPVSCCDTYYHGFMGNYAIDCDFSNKLANERYGCAKVILNYTSIIIQALAGFAIFTAFIGIISLIIGVSLAFSAKKRPRQVVQMESDSKKVLL